MRQCPEHPVHSVFSDFEIIISDFESQDTELLVCVAHPDRHGLSHALLEGETESAVTLIAAVMSQLLGGEGAVGCHGLTIEADKMIDTQIVYINIVTHAKTGEILTEIESVDTNRPSQLSNSQVVL